MRPLLLFLVALATAQLAAAQSWNEDMALLKEAGRSGPSNAYYARPGNDANLIRTKEEHPLVRYNPVTLLLKGTMYTYQHVISPQLSRHCPYEITCSNFSKQSIREFGIVKGVFMSADRILRCNRIGILDTDPLDFNDKDGTIKDSPNKYK